MPPPPEPPITPGETEETPPPPPTDVILEKTEFEPLAPPVRLEGFPGLIQCGFYQLCFNLVSFRVCLWS
jgi:hypothetical protein